MFAQNGSIPQQRQQHAHIQNQTQPSLEVVEVTVDQTLESHPEQGRTAGPDISPHWDRNIYIFMTGEKLICLPQSLEWQLGFVWVVVEREWGLEGDFLDLLSFQGNPCCMFVLLWNLQSLLICCWSGLWCNTADSRLQTPKKQPTWH